MRAELELEATQFTTCYVGQIQTMEIDQAKSPPEAKVAFVALVSVSDSRYTEGPGRGRVFIRLDLIQEPDGVWRIRGYAYDVE
jgi:hypothetical protein